MIIKYLEKIEGREVSAEMARLIFSICQKAGFSSLYNFKFVSSQRYIFWLTTNNIGHDFVAQEDGWEEFIDFRIISPEDVWACFTRL